MRTFSGRRQQARRLDRLVGEHPDVGRFDAFAHRDRARVRLVGDAAEAAGHHAPAVGRRRRIDAQHERPRRQLAVLPARRRRQPHDVLADEIDAARRRSRARSAARSASASSPPTTPRRRSEAAARLSPKAPAIEISSSAASTRSRSPGWPHHQVAMLGILQFLAEQPPREPRQERRAARAIRCRPEPGMFSTATPPARIASIRPGTPMREAELSSSGSHHSASTWRQSTSARLRPAIVRTNTRPSRTTRSSPSTSRKPR